MFAKVQMLKSCCIPHNHRPGDLDSPIKRGLAVHQPLLVDGIGGDLCNQAVPSTEERENNFARKGNGWKILI